MTEQEQVMKVVKAATAGFTQTLANKGYPVEIMGKAALLYAHPEGGMLQKRAALREAAKADILAGIQQFRAARKA